jgi:hypothetical protein
VFLLTNIINQVVSRFLLILYLAFAAFTVAAQERDSINDIEAEETSGFSRVFHAPSDTIVIQKKAFGNDKLQELKEDPSLDYTLLPTVGETLWDRILRWIGQFLESFFKGAYETNWGRFFLYVGLIALIAVLIMTILRVDAFRMFYSRVGTSSKINALEENIHEMDFEKLIQESINQQNFRKAIRLVFLYSLKLLADRQLILWELGKTNHDYVGELQRSELKTGLNELSYYFDYAWYGNFNVNRDTFEKVQQTFQDFRNKL